MVQQTWLLGMQSLSAEHSLKAAVGCSQIFSVEESETSSHAWPIVVLHAESSVQKRGQDLASLHTLPLDP